MRAELPAGTVTLLFTDIEGSTRLLASLGDAYQGVRADHLALLRDAVAAGGGVELGTEGDALFAVFVDARAAVRAAVDGQLALGTHAWPEGVNLKVRMGLHTGPLSRSGDDLVGMALHEVARVSSAGHGGQILVTAATAGLVGPDPWAFADLGEYEFKDLAAPMQVYEVRHHGLETGFPALRTRARTPGNLPVQLTNFIGRDKDVHDVTELVRANRLVTLTGAGGSGKTRLSLTVAERIPSDAGAWFIDLAAVTSDDAVVEAVAAALAFRAEHGRDLAEAVIEYMGTRDFLLVIDNCEHVIEGAAAFVDRLLRASPGPRVMATSREPLEIQGEVVWAVPTLDLDVAEELFVSRARAGLPSFAAEGEDAELVRDICGRLDCMPLAIELAAARVGTLPLKGIAQRLDDALSLLGGGRRGALARHQTLNATIDWSYRLLDDDERDLFERLSVFAAGFSLEAVDAVAGGASIDTFSRLVAKSLVLREDADRYRMLETLRQYGSARLDERGLTDEVNQAHARYWRDWVNTLVPLFEMPGSGTWSRRVESEHPNLRAAMEWSAASEPGADTVVEIVAGLSFVWFFRGMLSEVEPWMAIAEAASVGEESSRRCKILHGKVLIAMTDGRLDDLVEHSLVAADMADKVGDRAAATFAYEAASIGAWGLGHLERALELAELSEARAREAVGRWHISSVAPQRVRVLTDMGRLEEAEAEAQQSVALAAAHGEDQATGWANDAAAQAAMANGDIDLALARTEASLVHYREAGYEEGVASAFNRIGEIALMRGAVDEAADALERALTLCRRVGLTGGTVAALQRLAQVAESRQQLERASCLLGGAEVLRERMGSPLRPVEAEQLDAQVARLRTALGDTAFESARQTGRRLGPDAG